MTMRDEYLTRAAEFYARARSDTRHDKQIEFASLAKCYLRLAKQADRNSCTDVASEPPSSKLGDKATAP
jgi:hypothetical protein